MSQLKKELKRFLVAGFGAVGTDLFLYYIFLDYLSSNISKGISFLVGTIVAFVINKYWTFEKHDKSFKEIILFGILYGVTLVINVLTNKLVLDYTSIVLLSFLVATGVSTVLNFIGQKFWVFK
jgi:putative flippase GtrA